MSHEVVIMNQKLFRLFVVYGVVAAAGLTANSLHAADGAKALMSAEYHESVGDLQKAEEQYRVAASEKETREKGIVGLTNILITQGNTEEAGKILNKHLRDVNPFSLEVRLAYAKYLVRTGQAKKAEAEVEKVRKIRPGYSTVSYHEAKGDHHFGNKEFEKAFNEYSEAIRMENGNLTARKARSQAAMKLGRFDSAASDLRFVINERPVDFESHVLLGDALFAGKKYNEAEKVFQAANKLDPNSPVAIEKLAETYAKSGQYNKTCDTYILATRVANDPQNIAVRYGRYLVSQKQNRKAEEVFTEVLRVAPRNEDAAKELYWIYEKDGFLDKAGLLLSKQTQQFPSRTWAALAYTKILGQISRTDVANRVLRRTAESEKPDSPEAHILVGIAMVQEGNVKGAEKYFIDATKKFPGNPQVMFNLGLFYEKQDNLVEALKAYNKVSDSDPSVFRKARINMAVIYEKVENFEDAAEVLKEIDKKDRDNTVVAKIAELEKKSRTGVTEQPKVESKVQRSTASEKKVKEPKVTEEHSATE